MMMAEVEFMLQEMHRELNTIASKTLSAEVAHLVVDAKAAVDAVRAKGVVCQIGTQRRSEGRYKAALPFVLGQEGAGVVTAGGAGVAAMKPDCRPMSLIRPMPLGYPSASLWAPLMALVAMSTAVSKPKEREMR